MRSGLLALDKEMFSLDTLQTLQKIMPTDDEKRMVDLYREQNSSLGVCLCVFVCVCVCVCLSLCVCVCVYACVVWERATASA